MGKVGGVVMSPCIRTVIAEFTSLVDVEAMARGLPLHWEPAEPYMQGHE